MKTIFRNLAFGAVMTGVAIVSGTTAFAQDVCTEIEPQQALYKQFTDNLPKKDIPSQEAAVTAGKQYVEKYGACPESKQIVDYLNANLPKMEEGIKKRKTDEDKKALLVRFDTAAKSKNVPEIFASGKEILAREADFADLTLDVNITLAAAGFEQAIATTPTDTYNADTVNYAKNAIQKIESGKTSKSWGVWSYNIKPVDKTKFSDEKSYALGALNYMVGYVTSYRQGKDNAEKKKEALPYFYKSAQYNSFSKNDPTIYQAIGAWYLDEAIKIDKARQDILKASGNKDTDETLAMVGMQKGYADRAIDAYARAYKIAKDDKTQKKEYVDGLYTRLKELFAFRFDNNTSGVDAYIASVMSKPLVDPATAVTPVKEEAPATTAPTSNTSGSTTTSTMPASDTTTKPAAPATTKPANAATTSTDAKTSAATTKPATTKKPTTTKKKGTR